MITANEANRERWLNERPDLLTTSANRNLLQPTEDNRIRREGNIKEVVEEVTKKTQRKHSKALSSKSKSRSSSSKGKQKHVPNYKENENGEEGRAPMMKGMLRHHSSGSSSAKSDRSQVRCVFSYALSCVIVLQSTVFESSICLLIVSKVSLFPKSLFHLTMFFIAAMHHILHLLTLLFLKLVDLVVEDTVAEETERVRARKEGSAGWNETEPKRYV